MGDNSYRRWGWSAVSPGGRSVKCLGGKSVNSVGGGGGGRRPRNARVRGV